MWTMRTSRSRCCRLSIRGTLSNDRTFSRGRKSGEAVPVIIRQGIPTPDEEGNITSR